MRDISIKEAQAELKRLRGIHDLKSLILVINELDLAIDYAEVDDPRRLREIIRNLLQQFIIAEQARLLRRRTRVGLAWLILVFLLGAGVAFLNGYHLFYQPLSDKYEADVQKVLDEDKETARKLAVANADTIAKLKEEISRLQNQQLAAPATATAAPVSPAPRVPWRSRWRLKQPASTTTEPAPPESE